MVDYTSGGGLLLRGDEASGSDELVSYTDPAAHVEFQLFSLGSVGWGARELEKMADWSRSKCTDCSGRDVSSNLTFQEHSSAMWTWSSS